MADVNQSRDRCPMHNMTDCSPLLNGCSLLTARPILTNAEYAHPGMIRVLPELIAMLPEVFVRTRHRRDVSQRAAAEQMALSYNVVYRFEHGGNVALSTLMIIVAWINTPTVWGEG